MITLQKFLAGINSLEKEQALLTTSDVQGIVSALVYDFYNRFDTGKEETILEYINGLIDEDTMLKELKIKE